MSPSKKAVFSTKNGPHAAHHRQPRKVSQKRPRGQKGRRNDLITPFPHRLCLTNHILWAATINNLLFLMLHFSHFPRLLQA